MSIRVFVMVSMLRRVRNCRFIITDKQRRKKKLTGWVTDQHRPSQNRRVLPTANLPNVFVVRNWQYPFYYFTLYLLLSKKVL